MNHEYVRIETFKEYAKANLIKKNNLIHTTHMHCQLKGIDLVQIILKYTKDLNFFLQLIVHGNINVTNKYDEE